MTILNRLYASSGSEVILRTLEVNDGVTRHLLVGGWEDITARLETGENATFTACGLDVALPTRNADGTQDLTFTVCNITGEISAYVRELLASGRQCEIVARTYVSTDLLAPAEPPQRYKLKGGSWTSTEASLTAGYFNLLETAWPRNFYTPDIFPGTRYL